MKLLIAISILLTLTSCTMPDYKVTCYSGGKTVFEETLKYNKLSSCYEDEYGYCINIPNDCISRVVNPNK